MSPNFRLDLTLKRIRLWYALLLLVFVIFGLRLFYIQIIRYGHYHEAALSDQLKEYEIPATRGLIEAHEGTNVVPIVLNQELYTLYADPTLVKNASQDAQTIAGVIGGSASQYQGLLKTPQTRYVVLANKLTGTQSNKILASKMPGIGTQGQDYRTYPDGPLAAQVLGFVNNSGQGEYGIEGALNNTLAGQPGMLKAITDASGMPLVATPGNIDKPPVPGKNVVLTLNMGVQTQLEQILQKEYKPTYSNGLSAIVMDPNNGAIVAMADYPSYDPATYYKVSNYSLFENRSINDQLEPGSIMKLLTTAAALNQGVIGPDSTFYDPGYVVVDGFKIASVDFPYSSPHEISIGQVLRYSLNEGAVYALEQMGGGSLDTQGRNVWHDYMTQHFMLGQPTGIEQPDEASGNVPSPNGSSSINLQYANTAFGQGVDVTMLQMISAVSAILNGGTYYKPHLVEGYMSSNGTEQKQPAQIVKRNVVKPQVSADMQKLMEYVFNSNYIIYNSHLHPGYSIGGKTGTAQIAENGSYLPSLYNGTFMGFVGGSNNKPQYVVSIYNRRPNLPSNEYGGAEGAAPVFGAIADMLINDGYVTPN